MIVIRDSKPVCYNFDLPKDVDENLKHEIEFIIKTNESLTEITIKTETEQLLLGMETIFMNMENSKTNEPHKFIVNLSQRLDLKNSDKHDALQNLSIYYTWKNKRKKYKNNKLKIIAPTWNDKFELPDGCYSVSDIQDYNEFIIKKHETLATVPPIHIYINMINISV